MVLNSLGQFTCRQHYFQPTQHSEWIAFLPDWTVVHYASLKICFACIAEHSQEWFSKSNFEWSTNTRGQRSSQRSDDHANLNIIPIFMCFICFPVLSALKQYLLENVTIFCKCNCGKCFLLHYRITNGVNKAFFWSVQKSLMVIIIIVKIWATK